MPPRADPAGPAPFAAPLPAVPIFITIHQHSSGADPPKFVVHATNVDARFAQRAWDEAHGGRRDDLIDGVLAESEPRWRSAGSLPRFLCHGCGERCKGRAMVTAAAPGPQWTAWVWPCCGSRGCTAAVERASGERMKILDANTGDLDLMVEFGEGRDGRLEICLGCGSFPREKMSKCARCKATPYCGPACQKMDWPRHKLTCVPAAAASEESSSDSVTSVGKSASDGAP